MNEELEKLQKLIDEQAKTITDIRIKLTEELARRDGGQRVTAWWAAGLGVLIAVWLGATSFWQIPHTIQDKVNASAGGQAASAAQKALSDTQAAKDAAENIVKAMPSLGYAVPLAALTVKGRALVSSSKDVMYDATTGVVTFPNPKKLRFLPIVSDLAEKSSEPYITETHFIREIGTTNQFTVWRKPLDRGGDNSAPTSFTAIVIGIE